jgi:insertion element IS1 protein InsB
VSVCSGSCSLWLSGSRRPRREHLYVEPPRGTPAVILQRLEAELDELWNFVGKKANRHWVWIAMDTTTRQVLYRKHAVFYTDHYAAYTGVIPSAQHRAISKLARKTNHVERFNCTLRQRVSGLVRATLSFSKKLSYHIGAIKYFICDYNLTKCAALPE